jgi:hypothetical protein
MLARAFEAGVPAQWVVGDTLYGYDELRTWLEERHTSYVLAIPETHLVWMAGRQHPIGYQAALLPPVAWTVLSAGEGRKTTTALRMGLVPIAPGRRGSGRHGTGALCAAATQSLRSKPACILPRGGPSHPHPGGGGAYRGSSVDD